MPHQPSNDSPILRSAQDVPVLASAEAEQAVLGSLLISPDAVVDVADILCGADFYQQKNGWIYDAIRTLAASNAAADFVTVTDELERRRQLDEAGGAAYVMDLINAVPTAIHAEHYARIVQKYAVARRLLRGAGQIAQMLYEHTGDVDDMCSQAIAIVDDAAWRRDQRRARPLSEVLALTVEQAREHARVLAEGGQVSIPFGIPELDRRTGGLWPSDVVIVAARPGAGKTALALGLAQRAALAGFRGAVFSLEMQETQVGERILSPESGYAAIDIRLGNVADWQALDEARVRASSENLLVDDSPALTIAELATRVKRLHLRYGVQFVVVDYVQLLSAGKWTENRTQELAYISRQLKALAKGLGIAVLAVAQLSREHGKRHDKKPVMSDLEGSSQWEKDATAVLFIHRENELASETDARQATLILAKARNGQVGEFQVGWNPRLAQFTAGPLAMTEDERLAHRVELLGRCGALDLSWADWRVQRAPLGQLELLDARARQVAQALLSDGRVDRAAVDQLVAQSKASNGKTPAGVLELVGAAARAAVLQQVQEDVMPALLAGRFAVFAGPSGRGKTLMARIVQRALISEHGVPAVWLNWRRFLRDIKGSFDGAGREAEVWAQAEAPVLIVDDPDKTMTEWSVGYLYDLIDERMALTGGSQRAVLWVLNQMPREFGEQLARHGHLGVATAQRGLLRSQPVLVDFGGLTVWAKGGE